MHQYLWLIISIPLASLALGVVITVIALFIRSRRNERRIQESVEHARRMYMLWVEREMQNRVMDSILQHSKLASILVEAGEAKKGISLAFQTPGQSEVIVEGIMPSTSRRIPLEFRLADGTMMSCATIVERARADREIQDADTAPHLLELLLRFIDRTHRHLGTADVGSTFSLDDSVSFVQTSEQPSANVVYGSGVWYTPITPATDTPDDLFDGDDQIVVDDLSKMSSTTDIHLPLVGVDQRMQWESSAELKTSPSFSNTFSEQHRTEYSIF